MKFLITQRNIGYNTQIKLLTVSISWIVVEKTARSFVVTTKYNKVALVITASAETFLSNWKKTAVLNTTRTQIAQQQNGIH